MLRSEINDAYKIAMKQKETIGVSTLRLIRAALKDRDIAARGKGNTEEVSDDEILSLLQSMIKQRQDSIQAYEKGGRMELAQQEAEEIAIIENFLPEQMLDQEIAVAVKRAIAEAGASSLKDMGKVMGALKVKYAGKMDFGKASAAAKEKLGWSDRIFAKFHSLSAQYRVVSNFTFSI